MSVDVRGVARWIPRVAIIAMVVGLAVLVRRYDVERLDPGVRSLDGYVEPGSLLLFANVDEDTSLAPGMIVEAEISLPPDLAERFGGDRWLILSRIAAVPGQEIELVPRPAGGPGILVEGARTWAQVELEDQERWPAERRLRDGPVPPGHFLLLDPAGHQGSWDSRRLGLIPRSALRRKLMMQL